MLSVVHMIKSYYAQQNRASQLLSLEPEHLVFNNNCFLCIYPWISNLAMMFHRTVTKSCKLDVLIMQHVQVPGQYISRVITE